MATDKQSELREKLEALRASYCAQLPLRMAEIGETLVRVGTAPCPPDRLAELHRLLHKMTGSAGTFGFIPLALKAQELEKRVRAWLSAEADVPAEHLAELARSCAELQALGDGTDCSSLLAPVRAPLPPDATPGQRLVYIVEDDLLASQELSLQLHHFGYECRILDRPEALPAALAERMPDALIMDISFPSGRLAGPEYLSRIQRELESPLETIFTSANADIDARLAAVRAGANGYFTKPLDIGSLVERLDLLTLREARESYRVLIVDDQASLAMFHATVLRTAGMDIRIISDPLQTLNELPLFRPELVVIDMYMPGCNGLELAQIIRQQNVYTNLPIVFLSSESDSERQLEAIQSGGDEYLIKPIEPRHLVSAITGRAARYRTLMSLLQQDGLTGLYNHTAIKKSLARDLSQAKRTGRPLALVMLDIDNFKKINDTYGHPVGDQVIRALARLLKQRLRVGDVVGRYGGEEFVAILPGSTAQQAYRVIDEIRRSFSEITQHSALGGFQSCFSAGIAEYPGLQDASRLFESADQALYEAKRGGRNRVCLA